MKFYKSLLGATLALAACGAMVSCNDEFDRPPVIVPQATIDANTAISEFKNMYWDVAVANKVDTVGLTADGDSIIIGGRIISSDKEGNIYQQVIIEDASGAISIRVRGYDLYQKYQYGQDLRINVTGLVVGGYGQQIQIGTLYNNAVGGMEPTEFGLRAQINGLAEPEKINIPVLDPKEVVAFGTDRAKREEWGWRCVQLDSVSFDGGGTLAWTDAPGQTGSTNRTLIGPDGSKLTVRTSNKSTFAGETLPAGKGCVRAILGYYNSTWQLTVMNPATDCFGFAGSSTSTPDIPDTPSPTEVVFSETFESGWGQFTIENVSIAPELASVWSTYTTGKCLKATAYAGGVDLAADSYLVSPVIDLTSATAAVVNFEHAGKFFADETAMKQNATVCARVEGSKEWTTLVIPNYFSNADWTFVPSGDIDLKAFVGKKVQIALHYVSTTKAGTWEVKNLTVKK